MKNFKKEMKAKLNDEAHLAGANSEEFDRWYAANEDKLGEFSPVSARDANARGGVRVKRFLPAAAFIGLAFVMVMVLVILFVTNNGQEDNFTFSNDMVYSSKLSDSELSAVKDEYDFVDNMDVVQATKLLYKVDNSLVVILLESEVLSQDNYYFITLQIEYNEHYDFVDKYYYHNLDNSTTTDNFDVSYEQMGLDDGGLYTYLLRLESENLNTVYMEVHCFEDDISYILNEVL